MAAVEVPDNLVEDARQGRPIMVAGRRYVADWDHSDPSPASLAAMRAADDRLRRLGAALGPHLQWTR